MDMDMQGTYAAATQRLTEIGADGTGNAGSSSAKGPPSLGPESLDTPSDNVFRSPNPDPTLPARKPQRPAQIPFQGPTEAAKLPDP